MAMKFVFREAALASFAAIGLDQRSLSNSVADHVASFVFLRMARSVPQFVRAIILTLLIWVSLRPVFDYLPVALLTAVLQAILPAPVLAELAALFELLAFRASLHALSLHANPRHNYHRLRFQTVGWP